MKKASRHIKDKTLKFVSLLLQTEHANLHAKKNGERKVGENYKHKTALIFQLRDMAVSIGCHYGYNKDVGKNASSVVYFYLPNGTQVTWHCKEYTIETTFCLVDDKWDQQCNMNMQKILDYIGTKYKNIVCA